MSKHKIIVGITGASGSIYAKVLLGKLAVLKGQVDSVGIVMSDNAKQVWECELPTSPLAPLLKRGGKKFLIYGKADFHAPFASGSSDFRTMIVCPCSMGTMARIASGVSNDLITRAADVILKERKKLILIPRDTPFSLIHINNMKTITEAGGIICPASPSFYSKPKDFEQLASTVIDRALDLCGLEIKTYRWGSKGK
ncbi:MAG: UbiX family flavin prenyltransferase [Bacteroidetes bacterium]|nr:MAG: UbiX family flavin prenyltransferase [Bacteroidota bacterium]